MNSNFWKMRSDVIRIRKIKFPQTLSYIQPQFLSQLDLLMFWEYLKKVMIQKDLDRR